MSNHSIQPKDRYLGWKTLGVFVPVFVVSWIAGIAVGLATRQIGVLLHLSEPIAHALSFMGITAARLIVWVPAIHIVLKRRLRDLAFQLHRGWWSDVLGGIGITALAMSVAFVIGERSGRLVISGWMWQTLSFEIFLGRLWVSLLINTLVALGEETIFRAYLLTGLKDAWGRGIGLTIMMILFGLMHLPAYSEEGMHPFVLTAAILMAMAIGGLLGLIYLHTGSLWLPISIHFAWNLIENDLLNLTGDMTNSNLVGAITRLQGPPFLAGVGYGNAIAMDIIAFLVLGVGVWLWMSRRQRSTGQRGD